MFLHLTDVSDEPLHHQISRQVRAKILSGELEDGDSLPSIRGLAKDCRVSVITVQRSYENLEREGLILARRGKGFFVRKMSDDSKIRLARRRFRDALEPIVAEGRADGLDETEMHTIFQALTNSHGETRA